MDQEEGEWRRVGGEEAAAREGGFRDEERDWWCLNGRYISSGEGVGGGVFVDDTFKLAQVSRSHLPLFGFTLGKDAQPSTVRQIPLTTLFGICVTVFTRRPTTSLRST